MLDLRGGGVSNSVPGVLVRTEDTETQGPGRGRDWCCAVTEQGMPGTTIIRRALRDLMALPAPCLLTQVSRAQRGCCLLLGAQCWGGFVLINRWN